MLRRADDRDRALRRSVGPTAWTVLADLSLDACPDDRGVLAVSASARQVGANIGVGKDTAARALRRLIAAGLVSRRPQGTDRAGRFGHCTYELHVQPEPALARPQTADAVQHLCLQSTDAVSDPGPVSLVSATVLMSERRSSRRRGRVSDRTHGDQLSLLGPVAGGAGGPTETKS